MQALTHNITTCRCNAGTRGDVCEDIPDVCSVISSCTSMGDCKNSNGTAECVCKSSSKQHRKLGAETLYITITLQNSSHLVKIILYAYAV